MRAFGGHQDKGEWTCRGGRSKNAISSIFAKLHGRSFYDHHYTSVPLWIDQDEEKHECNVAWAVVEAAASNFMPNNRKCIIIQPSSSAACLIHPTLLLLPTLPPHAHISQSE